MQSSATHDEFAPGPRPSARRGRRFRRIALPILGVLVLVGVLGGVKACQISTLIRAGRAAEQAGPPPEAVGTTKAERQSWERTLWAVGSVVSDRGVAVANEAPGVVSRLHFESGDRVERGQLLVELDTAVERAQLRSTLARLEGARVAFQRSSALAEEGVVSQAQRDADEATFNSLTAEANAIRAEIERKTVRAPFTGKLGIREVQLGQFLPAGTTISVLESDESVYVDFTLPQNDLELVQLGLKVRLSWTRDQPPVAEGTVEAVDPSVDPVTRAIGVRASVPKDEALRPGMFMNVQLVLPEKREVIVVPLTAVIHASFGDSVFVADPKPGAHDPKAPKIARQQFVRLGDTRGDFVAVTQGLRAGEEVVSAGAFKLRNGVPIVVDNRVQPKPQLDPRPENR